MTRRHVCGPAQALFLTCVFLVLAGLVPSPAVPDAWTQPAPAPIRLTSLEWPPFSGRDLPNGGLSTAIVTRTMDRAGLPVTLDFLPWQRAVHTGLTVPGYLGYFPEYRTTATTDGRCLLSAPIGSSPLGFAERASAPVTWRGLADLSGRRIGTVRGYVNTDSFDAAVAKGQVTVEPAVDDATNLRKLAAGRLDLIVIDANVMAHLLNTDADLRPLRDGLRFNARILEDKTLHVCFRPGERGEELLRLFNTALADRGPESVMEAARPAANRPH